MEHNERHQKAEHNEGVEHPHAVVVVVPGVHRILRMEYDHGQGGAKEGKPEREKEKIENERTNKQMINEQTNKRDVKSMKENAKHKKHPVSSDVGFR